MASAELLKIIDEQGFQKKKKVRKIKNQALQPLRKAWNLQGSRREGGATGAPAPWPGGQGRGQPPLLPRKDTVPGTRRDQHPAEARKRRGMKVLVGRGWRGRARQVTRWWGGGLLPGGDPPGMSAAGEGASSGLIWGEAGGEGPSRPTRGACARWHCWALGVKARTCCGKCAFWSMKSLPAQHRCSPPWIPV